jgi:hypothetical protein
MFNITDMFELSSKFYKIAESRLDQADPSDVATLLLQLETVWDGIMEAALSIGSPGGEGLAYATATWAVYAGKSYLSEIDSASISSAGDSVALSYNGQNATENPCIQNTVILLCIIFYNSYYLIWYLIYFYALLLKKKIFIY